MSPISSTGFSLNRDGTTTVHWKCNLCGNSDGRLRPSRSISVCRDCEKTYRDGRSEREDLD